MTGVWRGNFGIPSKMGWLLSAIDRLRYCCCCSAIEDDEDEEQLQRDGDFLGLKTESVGVMCA